MSFSGVERSAGTCCAREKALVLSSLIAIEKGFCGEALKSVTVNGVGAGNFTFTVLGTVPAGSGGTLIEAISLGSEPWGQLASCPSGIACAVPVEIVKKNEARYGNSPRQLNLWAIESMVCPSQGRFKKSKTSVKLQDAANMA